MEGLMLQLAIEAPYGFPWEKTLKNRDLILSKDDMTICLRNLNLNNFEKRKEFSWNVELAAYESALESNGFEDIVRGIKTKLEKFKQSHSYIDDEVVHHALNFKGLNTEKKIDIFKKALGNALSAEEKLQYKRNISSWLIEIAAWNSMLNGLETVEEIIEDVFNLLNNKFSYLGADRNFIKIVLTNLGIRPGKNITLFVSSMKSDNNRYKNFISMEKLEVNTVVNSTEAEDELLDLKEVDITDSILDLFENMEERDSAKSGKNKKKPSKAKHAIKSEDEVNGTISSNEDKTVSEVKDITTEAKGEIDENAKEESRPIKLETADLVYKNLSALVQSLGYDLLDRNKMQVANECYEKMSSSKGVEEKVVKHLLSLENGAVLSQLYNVYKNLSSTSLGNIEAVMSNFFSALFILGFEVYEEDARVGEMVTVNTKDLFKEFMFSKPVEKNGEVNGEVQYLSWGYKDKMIMPKIIKPLE